MLSITPSTCERIRNRIDRRDGADALDIDGHIRGAGGRRQDRRRSADAIATPMPAAAVRRLGFIAAGEKRHQKNDRDAENGNPDSAAPDFFHMRQLRGLALAVSQHRQR